MRILAVADEEAPSLDEYYKPGCLDEYDLIISCGDLHRSYLEFLVTMSRNAPLLYVHGNHDDRFEKEPPEGCECIDDDLVVINGVRILGLGGSYRYKNSRYMYTEKQMIGRIVRLLPKILRHRGFDILVTHAPARHLGDWESMSHRGFECFIRLMERFHPKYMLHGHMHMNYGHAVKRKQQYGDTTIINCWQRYDIEI